MPERDECDGGRVYQPRVVVKFNDDIDLPYEDDIEEYLEKCQVGPVDEFREEFPGIEFKRLYTTLEPETIRELVEEATECDRSYQPPNLLTYFVIECPPGVNPEAVRKHVQEWWTVEDVYVEGGPTPPPSVNASDDPRSPNQDYLDPAPDGIDAEFAWTRPGGSGDGLAFIDLERGWTLNHEDLNGASISLLSGVNKDYHGHGTSVLGEVAAVDNSIGCIGITSDLASVRVVSQWRTSSTYNTADAIISAIDALDFGDVLLLEAQTSTSGFTKMPVEVEQAVFDTIRLGTALGVVIVEAAGNGGNDLDTFTRGGDQVLNRGSSDFEDSGAIMVGAATSTAPHTRMGFSNYGSRIDCYGWGENVNTTGDGWTGTSTTAYTSSFNGTSSASPIVAGAGLSVQGMVEHARGYRFSPRQLREILSRPPDPGAAPGTQNTPSSDPIGVMPNLHWIANDILNTTSDIYLRDFVGDTGDPHTGAISTSPDVILRPSPVANPQTAFGEGSGTENDNTLGFEAEAGQDNYLYVRVRNRGGAVAAPVTVTVYWAPVATLLTPDLWNLVGSTTIPTVPTGDVLTVSDAITWEDSDIPGPGHYCFIGFVGTDDDPAPDPADFQDWDNYRRFIRENNNVTWRNFNVVNNTPPPAARFVELPFLAPGAPERAREMRLEFNARLPDDARLYLKMPEHFFERIDGCRRHQRELDGVDERDRGEKVYLPINPQGQELFDEILFPAKSRVELRLLVNIPEQHREEVYEVYVRQLYEEEEVGRVTWQLAPKRRRKREDDVEDRPITYVKGIAEVVGERLRSAGIQRVSELSEAPVEEVADTARVSEERAEKYVEMSRFIALGADDQLAEALIELGISADDLAEIDLEEIAEIMEAAIESGEVDFPADYRLDKDMLERIVERARDRY